MPYYFDEERKAWYHFEPRKIRIGDNINIAEMRSQLEARAEAGEISEERMLSLSNYILMLHAHKCIEYAPVQELPENDSVPMDAEWRKLQFNEDAFIDMDENFVTVCIESIYQNNPQRGLEYEFLKKTLEILQGANNSGLTTSKATTPANETGSAND